MLILASQSPRRREILTAAGIEFVVRAAAVEERRGADEDPLAYVRRLARDKARAVEAGRGDVVLGADTVVVAAAGEVLEKPADAADARRMLELLAGRAHTVSTGICLRAGEREIVDVESTRVHFLPMTAAEIEGYAASGEPMDKAGGYAIQGLAGKWIGRIEGCYFNVVGLPLAMVYRHLKTFDGQAG